VCFFFGFLRFCRKAYPHQTSPGVKVPSADCSSCAVLVHGATRITVIYRAHLSLLSHATEANTYLVFGQTCWICGVFATGYVQFGHVYPYCQSWRSSKHIGGSCGPVAPSTVHSIWWNTCMIFVGESAHMNRPMTCELRHLCGCNMGRFPVCFWSCAIYCCGKHDQTAHNPDAKAPQNQHVGRILNMYSPFCVGKRWLRCARYNNASCAMYVGPPGGQSTWRNYCFRRLVHPGVQLHPQIQLQLPYILHNTTLHYANYTAPQIQLKLHYFTLHYTRLHYTMPHYSTQHYYSTLHYTTQITPYHSYNCNCNYTTLIILHYNYNYNCTTQHYIQQLWRGDHCNHCNHSKKHNSNHLSVHQWIRSAIHASQQRTSPIGFLFLKLPPPPCAVLLVYIYIIYRNSISLCVHATDKQISVHFLSIELI